MFKNFTAKIRKWAGLPFQDVNNLLKWQDLNKSGVDFHNPNLLVASATDENGAVAYTTIEPTWILSGYAFRPKLSEETIKDAGYSMDPPIVAEARAQGIGRVLIVLPDGVPPVAGEKHLRFVERRIPETINIEIEPASHVLTQPIEKELEIDEKNQTAKWVN